MMKRSFDIICSLFGLGVFICPMAVIALVIKLTSKGPVLYTQRRVGWHEQIFFVYKFRTMVDKADTLGTSVTTGIDPRITPVGRFLRKTKLDELPQLFNVLKGDMSFIGPRPDVPEITAKYTPAMKQIFSVRPGITSVATLHFRHEEDILAKVKDPDKFYDEVVVPLKVELSMEHVRRNSFWFDFLVLLQTVWVLTPLGKVWPVKELAAVEQFKEKYSL
jgi:lipopolysaccharide/colanic/teichoic acid biosynthesis glycosyltransferase